MAYKWNGAVVQGTPGQRNWTYTTGDPVFYGDIVVDENLFINRKGYMLIGHRYLTNNDQKELKELWDKLDNFQTIPVTTWKSAILVKDLSSTQKYGDIQVYQNKNGTITKEDTFQMLMYGTSLNWSGYQYAIANSTETPEKLEYYSDHVNFFNYNLPFFDNEDEMKKWLADDTTIPETSESGAGGVIGNNAAKGEYTGFIAANGVSRIYDIDRTNLANLSTVISSGWIADLLGADKIGDAIIDIKGLMTPGPLKTGSKEFICRFKDTHVEGSPVTIQGQKFNFGTFRFNEYYKSFLDYTPSTEIKLFLPYCGMQTLDASIVMNSSVRLSGVIDIVTGNILYYLEMGANDDFETSSTSVLYSWTGNVSCEIPISAEDYGQKVSAAISMAGTVAATIAIPETSAASAIVPGTIQGIGNTINASQTSSRFITSGSMSSNNGFGGVQYPYIIITRPVPEYPANYGHYVGYPSMKTATLNSLEGYTKIHQIFLNGFTSATDDELTELNNLLKSGILL